MTWFRGNFSHLHSFSFLQEQTPGLAPDCRGLSWATLPLLGPQDLAWPLKVENEGSSLDTSLACDLRVLGRVRPLGRDRPGGSSLLTGTREVATPGGRTGLQEALSPQELQVSQGAKPHLQCGRSPQTPEGSSSGGDPITSSCGVDTRAWKESYLH